MSAPAAAPAAWAGELATNRTVNAPAIEQAAGEFQQVTGQAVRAQDLASKNAQQIIQRDLAKAHQRLQLSAWDRALRQLATAWPLLDFNDLDGTQRQWLAANLEIAQQAQGAAGRIATRYLDNARIMAVGSPLGAQLDGLAGRPPKELAESMRLNGPVFIKTMMASGRPAASIEKAAFSMVMGDLMKSVMDIPRNATIESSWKDDQSTGVVWVTDGKPCDWCRQLAGWEAKAIQPGTGTGGHAHCGCVYQPSYQSAPTRRGSAKPTEPVKPAPEVKPAEVKPAVSEQLTAQEAVGVYAWGDTARGLPNGLQLNGLLRAGEPLPTKYRPVIESLDAAIDAERDWAGNKAAKVVYRAISGADQAARFAKAKPGSVVTDSGYMSTTTDKRVLEDFVLDDDHVEMFLVVPKGNPLMEVNKVLGDKVEYDQTEWLLPRDTKIKIRKVTREGRVVKVSADVVPVKTKPKPPEYRA